MLARVACERAESLAPGVEGRVFPLRLFARLRQPACAPEPLHRGRERFIERGVVGHVDHLVRQFVKQDAGEFAFGVSDEGVEQRVAAGPVHPAQR
ncbi:hypothetical protein D9M68_983090 [compost metagenome]